MPLHVSSTCAHHQEVKIALHSLWYHHTYRCLFHHTCRCKTKILCIKLVNYWDNHFLNIMVIWFVPPVVWYVRTLWRVLVPPYPGYSETSVPLYPTRRRHISEDLYHNIFRQLYLIHVFTTVLCKLLPVLPSHGDLLLCVLFFLSSFLYSYQNFNDHMPSSAALLCHVVHHFPLFWNPWLIHVGTWALTDTVWLDGWYLHFMVIEE